MENITANLPAPVNATLDETAAYLKVSRRTVQLYQERIAQAGLLREDTPFSLEGNCRSSQKRGIES